MLLLRRSQSSEEYHLYMNSSTNPVTEYRSTLQGNAARYEVLLNEDALGRLCGYYELILAWNTRLHLVAPCSPFEFATRHVLESLFLTSHLPKNARVADIGSGAGLPIIPILIIRSDIQAMLIEASLRKCVFLREALRHCELQEQASVAAERFENVPAPMVEYVSCRALDRFTQTLSGMIRWSPRPATLLLYGGETLRQQIEKAGLNYSSVLIPDSERRFLFVCKERSP